MEKIIFIFLSFHLSTITCFAFRQSLISASSQRQSFSLYDQVASDQKNGKYDYLTLPFHPDKQVEIEDYYGPIEILFSEGKGRGLFVTRDVIPGELLMVEKAFAFHEHTDAEIQQMDSVASMTEKGTQDYLRQEIKRMVHSDRKLNTKLSYLAYSLKESNNIIPDMESFRTNEFAECDHICSDDQIAGAIDVNVFTFLSSPEPTMSERIELSKTLAVGVNPQTFVQGCFDRSNALKNNPMNDLEKRSRCSALWIVASFMNHRLPSAGDSRAPPPTPFFAGECGRLFIVYALTHMKKGDEITIFYEGSSDDSKSMLSSYWGIPDNISEPDSISEPQSVSGPGSIDASTEGMSRQMRRAMEKKAAKAAKKQAAKKA